MSSENPRVAEYGANQMFLDRWSPRAFTGEAMSHDLLLGLLEAARWAPSCANSQPWRFVYAHRDTAHWETLLGLLNASNQAWAKHAAVLLVVASKKTMLMPGAAVEVPSPTFSFDTGAAWMSLALAARLAGWDTHAMAGFDGARAVADLGIPEGYRVEAAIAIGKRGDAAMLPEAYRAREAPSPRIPVEHFAFEGTFHIGV